MITDLRMMQFCNIHQDTSLKAGGRSKSCLAACIALPKLSNVGLDIRLLKSVLEAPRIDADGEGCNSCEQPIVLHSFWRALRKVSLLIRDAHRRCPESLMNHTTVKPALSQRLSKTPAKVMV